jgi:hypothetical protein
MGSATFTYGLMAYVIKELLDDESDEYLRSPVGAHLEREKPGQSERSGVATFTGSVVPSAIPAYRVRPGTTLRDLWFGSTKKADATRSTHFSLDPKIGAGRVGVILGFRW